ncbi:MAG: alpha/beta fold hydrolase [Candidatus Helarchaeota archaeon]
MFFKSNDGAKIEYEVFGEGERVVIFLHGWGIGSSFFSEQIPVLVKEGYKVVTMNARFHGKSDRNSEYYEQFKDQLLDLMLLDFTVLIQHLKLKKFTYIGHSAGGGVGLVLANTKGLKRKIETMILVNSAYTISEHPSVLLLWELVPYFLDLLFNPILRTGYKLILQRESTITALSLALGRPRKNVRGWIEDILSIPKESLLQEYRNFKRYNLKEQLKNIRCPTLIIGAELDLVTPVYLSKTMHKEIPNSELYIIKGAGHTSMIEKPRIINKKILEYLRKYYPAKN